MVCLYFHSNINKRWERPPWMKCSFITFPSLSRNLKFSPFLNDIRRILLLIFHSKKWYVYSNMPDIHITFLCLRLHDHLKINEKFIIISLRSAYKLSSGIRNCSIYIKHSNHSICIGMWSWISKKTTTVRGSIHQQEQSSPCLNTLLKLKGEISSIKASVQWDK